MYDAGMPTKMQSGHGQSHVSVYRLVPSARFTWKGEGGEETDGADTHLDILADFLVQKLEAVRLIPKIFGGIEHRVQQIHGRLLQKYLSAKLVYLLTADCHVARGCELLGNRERFNDNFPHSLLEH